MNTLRLLIACAAWSISALSVAEPFTLFAKGNRIVDASGKAVVLRGVNVACMEWSADGEGHVLESAKVAVRDWKSNVVRLPLAQDRWFGVTPEQKDKGAAYRALVHQVVDQVTADGAYVILDLHWNDAGYWGQQIGQHLMPDRNSLTFWRDCARTYANRPGVIFDLYNEPHDISWDVWLNGGTVTEHDRQRNFTTTYEAAGMQQVLDTVRKTGARNLVVVGALDWSYDLKGVVEGKVLRDPSGNGVLYACHAYPFKGDTVEQWLEKMRLYTKSLPVIVSEFGSAPVAGRSGSGKEWVQKVTDALMANQWHFTAWDLHPAAGPSLISDWKYTPTPHFGEIVKAALARGH